MECPDCKQNTLVFSRAMHFVECPCGYCAETEAHIDYVTRPKLDFESQWAKVIEDSRPQRYRLRFPD